jgi:glycosyltransferase involved in cell wall biosynthesis
MRLHTHPLMQKWNWPEGLRLARLVQKLVPAAVLLIYTGNAFEYQPMLTFAASIVKRVQPRARFVTLIPFPLGARLSQGGFKQFHRFLLKKYGSRVSKEYGTLLHDSNHVVVMSSRHMPDLERHFPQLREKSTLIPPALIMPMAADDPKTRKRTRIDLGIAEDEFLFAYFGYLYATKGLETLIPAFQKLRQRHDKVRLLLVGGGNQSKDDGYQYVTDLKNAIHDLDLANVVRFTGGFPWNSDLGSRYLRAADAAVLPFDQGVSLNNSSFASVIAHGLPTVTTRGDVLENPLEHRRNVFLCCPQDPEELANAMKTVATDRRLRQDLHGGALELESACFSWGAATASYLSVLAGSNPSQNAAIGNIVQNTMFPELTGSHDDRLTERDK